MHIPHDATIDFCIRDEHEEMSQCESEYSENDESNDIETAKTDVTLLPYRVFLDVMDTMNNKFGYNDGKLSAALDLISLYLKGQKMLFIPDTIRYRYPTIYNKNMFMDVIKMHIDEMKFCNELKVICNDEIDARNKIIGGDKSNRAREELKHFYVNKNEKITSILEYRKTRTECDVAILNELNNINYNGSKWLCY